MQVETRQASNCFRAEDEDEKIFKQLAFVFVYKLFQVRPPPSARVHVCSVSGKPRVMRACTAMPWPKLAMMITYSRSILAVASNADYVMVTDMCISLMHACVQPPETRGCCGWWWSQKKKVTRRVVGPKNCEGKVFITIYNGIPLADLDMLWPEGVPNPTRLDVVLVVVPFFIGLCMSIYKIAEVPRPCMLPALP